jgi:hypothetical protein
MTQRIQAVLFTLALAVGFAVTTAPPPAQAASGGYCIGTMQEDDSVEWHCGGGLDACSSSADCVY